ncbi:hypothetical protein ABZ714_13145 [Streptomyces sp. NPDC006798]|uniref:hypothetical protein n=1 Tax=Streptomyces sp. NPDC006798 TaxID=3155462 RepID=UPI0033ED11B1
MLTLERVANETMTCGGFTWARSRTNPVTGFMVATPGYEKVIKGWDGSTATIASFVTEHILEVSTSNTLWFGSWMEGGDLYLDISENIADMREALNAGRCRGEISIWDCELGKVVYC